MKEPIVRKSTLKGENLEILDKRKLVIEGDLIACQITVNSDLEVYGNIIDTLIQNNGGSVSVSGGIRNSKVWAFSDLNSEYIEASDVTSQYGGCYIRSYVSQSSVSAMSLIHLLGPDSEVLGSSLSSSIEILSAQVGQFENSKPALLELKPRKKQDLFKLFFIYKQKLGEKEKHLEVLSRTIKVFSLIRDKIHSLPLDRKQELLKKVQEYQKLKESVETIYQERSRIFLKNQEESKYNRAVLVKKILYPPAKIIIDGQEMEIHNTEERVGFYKSGIIIRGEIEKIYTKRKIVAMI